MDVDRLVDRQEVRGVSGRRRKSLFDGESGQSEGACSANRQLSDAERIARGTGSS